VKEREKIKLAESLQQNSGFALADIRIANLLVLYFTPPLAAV